jgi:hypothetical protein
VEKLTQNQARQEANKRPAAAWRGVNSSTGCVISRVAGSAEGWSCRHTTADAVEILSLFTRISKSVNRNPTIPDQLLAKTSSEWVLGFFDFAWFPRAGCPLKNGETGSQRIRAA